MTHRTLLFAAAATAALSLAACDKAQQQAPATGAPIAALPLASAAPPPEQVAPYANQLPPAPPLPRARPRRAAYSYVDDAYSLGDTFADSPPDYTVDYDGEYPWVWRTDDGAYRVVEDTPDGWCEYFYYGDSAYPFLIRAADYTYAYDGPDLVVIYDSYGRPYNDWSPTIVDYGSRFFYRGQQLYNAAIHEQRRAAFAGDWRAHSAEIAALHQQWTSQQQSDPAWRAVHDQRAARQDPRVSNWNRERTQRVAYAARTAPLIAAAPAAPSPRRERPGFANAPTPPPAALGREQAIAEARNRDAQRAAQMQAAQQNRLAAQQAQQQQHAQILAQDRALADRRRADELAARNQHQAQMAQAQQARQQQIAQEQQAREQQRAQMGQAQQARQQQRAQMAQQQQAREQQRAQIQAQDRAQADQRRQAELAARNQQQAQMAQEREAQVRSAEVRQQADQARMARQMQMQAQRDERQQQAEAQRSQQAEAQRAARDQQAQAERAQRAEAQRSQMADAQRAAREQQAQAMRAEQHQQQQQAQAEQARRGAEQQQRQAQVAQAAAQHAQQAAAVAAQHGQGGGNPHPQKPEKKEKPQQ